MKMKNGSVFVAMLLLVLFSTGLLAFNGSVATADDYTAAELNPAALMFGNASGIAFEDFFNEEKMEGRYKIFFNGEGFAFIYGKDGSRNDYRIATSTKLFRNFYLGGDIYWINSKIKDADYAVSTLIRPHDMLSFGLNVKEVNRKYPGYYLGLGVRPLLGRGNLGDRVTITGDVSYTEKIENGRREITWNKPTLGLETEIFNGIRLGGTYNFEQEAIGINFSLAAKKARVGSALGFDENNDYRGGKYYIFLSNKDHRTLPLPVRMDNLYDFELKKEIVDEKEKNKFGPFLMVKNQVTMEGMIDQIRTLKDDESIKGIVFKNPELKTNYANMLELRKEFLEFKEVGKKIIVYSDNFGNMHYVFFASIADELYLNPNGMVGMTGFSLAIPYITELLDKLGIDVADLRSHDFKTAFNMITESEMTTAERETYNALLDDYYLYMTRLLEEGRGSRMNGNVNEIIDNGPYLLAQDALNAGLVDKIIYEDELQEELKHYFTKPRLQKELPNDKMQIAWSEAPTTKIAVIYATGDIVMSKGAPGKRIGGKTTAEQIKKAREDSSVQGIILRVNSGGGSAYASDLIAREVKKCREVGKPVVVSMGGAAASGGYYISAYADRIVAEPTTVTGSIGVTGLIPNFSRLFDKIAIRWSSLQRGERADILAFYKPLEEEDIEMLRSYILDSYDQFVNVVAEGRDMSYDEVHRIAQGRVWTGMRAQELGLVDELGGMKEAIVAMKELGGFKDIRLEDYSYKLSGFAVNIGVGGILAKTEQLVQLPEELQRLADYKEQFDLWQGERGLYLIPFFEVNGLK